MSLNLELLEGAIHRGQAYELDDVELSLIERCVELGEYPSYSSDVLEGLVLVLIEEVRRARARPIAGE